jgi:nitrite reductase (NO-forming)
MRSQSWFDGWCIHAQVIGLSFGILLATSSVLAETHDIAMTAIEKEVVIDGEATTYKAWTFNAQLRGSVVRVTEGDSIKFTLTNPSSNTSPHAVHFHAAEINFLKDHRAINPGEIISYTFVAKKPGVLFYHCGAPPMIQHVARGMIGAIIVDPLDAHAWPKADREYVVVQSEFFTNPDDAPAMLDRKFDNVVSTGGFLKCHPFVTNDGNLDAKPGERVRMYFVQAGPNAFLAFHPIGEIWDNVYESGNVGNKFSGVQTYTVRSGSASTFSAMVESAEASSLATHSLTGTLRGAIAVLVVSPDATSAPSVPMVPWDVPASRPQ